MFRLPPKHGFFYSLRERFSAPFLITDQDILMCMKGKPAAIPAA